MNNENCIVYGCGYYGSKQPDKCGKIKKRLSACEDYKTAPKLSYNKEKHNVVDRPNKITFYDINNKMIHVNSFKFADDATRIYNNMIDTIKERQDKFNRGISSDVYKITLSTIHKEFNIDS